MWNIVFLVTGLAFILLLLVIFFRKDTINTKENQLFKILIVINAFSYFFELTLQIIVRTSGVETIFVDIFSRLYMIVMFIWFTVFSVYTFAICMNKDLKEKYDRKLKKVKTIHIGFIIVGAFSFFLLPFEKFYDQTKMYIYGSLVDIFKLIMLIYMICWFILIFKNLKMIKNKKYLPIFLVLVLLIVSPVIQSVDPSILISNMIGTFICYTMSFTIENPDLRLLQELANNRRLTESNLEEKSNMLFQVSQEVKNPLMEITDLSSKINKSNDKEEIKEKSFKIENISRNAIGVINNVLDISQMDTQNIKFTNHTYDIYKVLKEIVYVTKNKYREEGKNIDFKYSISNTIPTALHGDPLKLKQIICSILFNAFANTDDGYIDLDITQMTKYNTCRLIITISDSGKGLSYNEINDLLNDSKELDGKELEKVEDLDMDLELTKKVIDLLGGSLLIKSEEDQGATFTVILNQQIASSNDEMKTLVDNLSNKKKVLLIDDDYLELDRFSYELKKNSLEVVSTMYGHDCIEKLANKEKFDLILVDDELDEYNALNILEDIKKLKLKNQKVVIMLEQQKEFMKNKFLNDYPFTDYLLKDDYKNEIVRIKDKYL